MAILPEYVADTHALYWYLLNIPLLGPNASAVFNEADQGRAIIVLPSIMLCELYYLNVKQGRPLDYARTLAQLMSSAQYVFVDFRAEDTLQFDALAAIPEMHDRMIAGAAIARSCAVLTRDVSITNSGLVPVVW